MKTMIFAAGMFFLPLSASAQFGSFGNFEMPNVPSYQGNVNQAMDLVPKAPPRVEKPKRPSMKKNVRQSGRSFLEDNQKQWEKRQSSQRGNMHTPPPSMDHENDHQKNDHRMNREDSHQRQDHQMDQKHNQEEEFEKHQADHPRAKTRAEQLEEYYRKREEAKKERMRKKNGEMPSGDHVSPQSHGMDDFESHQDEDHDNNRDHKNKYYEEQVQQKKERMTSEHKKMQAKLMMDLKRALKELEKAEGRLKRQYENSLKKINKHRDQLEEKLKKVQDGDFENMKDMAPEELYEPPMVDHDMGSTERSMSTSSMRKKTPSSMRKKSQRKRTSSTGKMSLLDRLRGKTSRKSFNKKRSSTRIKNIQSSYKKSRKRASSAIERARKLQKAMRNRKRKR